MKRLVLLFAALLVTSCGEKPTAPSETPNSLNYDEAERLLKDAVHLDVVGQLLKQAVDISSLRREDDLAYLDNETEPFSGWVKEMYSSDSVMRLGQYKDGEKDGLQTVWHENGQKAGQRDDGVFNQFGARIKVTKTSTWHENGQKASELMWEGGEFDEPGKDGKVMYEEYWNSKGEEVETAEEKAMLRALEKLNDELEGSR